VKNRQKKCGWVWLAIIAVAVASASSADSASPQAGGLPILRLLAAHADPSSSHAAIAALRARPAAVSASSRPTVFAPSLFRAMLASEFVGLVSPLTPLSAHTLLKLQQRPSPPGLTPLFQRPPPSQS
jgi:hypothetical protein